MTWEEAFYELCCIRPYPTKPMFVEASHKCNEEKSTRELLEMYNDKYKEGIHMSWYKELKYCEHRRENN